MANLKPLEKRYFEDLFGMKAGFVLDFTNPSFEDFFRTVADTEIYDDKYARSGGSKACRLRAFWDAESDVLVGRVLSEMLDLWEYRQLRDGQKPTHPNLSRCQIVVARLLSEDGSRNSAERAFMDRDFGEVPITSLSIEPAVLPLLQQRLDEASRCMASGAPLAAIFHFGSILEGALLGLSRQHAREFNQATSSPKDRAGNVLPFHKWSLSQFIDVGCALGFLPLDVKKFSHALRDFRNYIHPFQQLASGFQPDLHTARICKQVLNAALSSLNRKRSTTAQRT